MSNLPKFSVQDKARPVRSWLRTIRANGDANCWNERQMIVAAIQCLEGPAKTWSKGLQAARMWAHFPEDIEEEFGDAVSTADIIISLQKTKKRANETLREYLRVMRNLGEQANLEDRDIIRFIAEGLTDDGQVG